MAPSDEVDANTNPHTSAGRHSRAVIQDSFLESGLLKHIQRQVDNLAIESEFDPKVNIISYNVYWTTYLV